MSQRKNEQAVTSLKAYRVEFVEPLTEYPGTDNGRGEHQNALVSGILDALRACCKFKALGRTSWRRKINAAVIACSLRAKLLN
jgi:hypothetical protein